MKCIIDKIKIQSIATCLPNDIFELSTLKEIYNEKDIKNRIKTTGISRVHIAKEKETTSDLCFKAAELVLSKENIDRSEIDGVVFVSQTFDYLYPATSVVLQNRLNLSKETICFDISYGCSGYINGLFQASSLIKSGACKKVLLMVGDTNSKIINPNNLGAKMVFGDAGAATILTIAENGSIGFNLCSDGSGYDVVINQNGGFRNWPENQKSIDYSKNANKGDDVFTFVVSSTTQSIKTILELMNWNKEEVDFYALHQATKFTVDFIKKKLKLSDDKAPFTIMNCGNIGPATVPYVITDYSTTPNINTKTWKKVIMSASGVGLSWGSVACDLSETHIYKPINQDVK